MSYIIYNADEREVANGWARARTLAELWKNIAQHHGMQHEGDGKFTLDGETYTAVQA